MGRGADANLTLGTVIAAVDGSDASVEAATTGLALLRPADNVVVATVIELVDATLVAGTGLAGGVMSPAEYEELEAARTTEGREHVEAAAAALAADGIRADEIETLVLRGEPGPALCDLAVTRSARAIVVGSRGRGGIKRALLGSVSDHVARNAPCPVVVVRPTD